MKIKNILLIIIILLIAFTSFGCNGTKKVTEPVEIHFQFWGPKSMSTIGPRGSLFTDAIENFHKLNPLITVILDYWPETMIQKSGDNNFFSSTPEDTQKLLESKESPDIIGISLVDLPVVDKKGLLFDLFQMPGSQEIDINKAILDLATKDGKLLTLPYSANPRAIQYNKDLFDKANIPYPQDDWTWEQLREISKVVNPTHNPVLNYQINIVDLLMGSMGKGLLSPDGLTSVGYLDSPEAIRTVQWLNAYYHDSGQNTVPKFDEGFKLFDDQKAGMILGGLDLSFATFTGDNASHLGVAPLPHFAAGKRVNPTNFNGYGISQNSKHPQEAWEFIKYLTLSKNDDSIKLVGNAVATSKLLAEATGQRLDPVKRTYVDELNFAANQTDSSFFIEWYGMEGLNSQFEKLLTTKDEDIPAKLHGLALKFDQAIKKSNNVRDQQTNSTSP